MELDTSVLTKAQQLQAELDRMPHPKKILRRLGRLLMLSLSPDMLRQTGLRRSVRRLRKYEQLGSMARDLAEYWKVCMELQAIQEAQHRPSSPRRQAPKRPREATAQRDPQPHTQAPEGQACSNPELSPLVHTHKRHRGCSQTHSPQPLSSEHTQEGSALSQGQTISKPSYLKACEPQHRPPAQDKKIQPTPGPCHDSQEGPSLHLGLSPQPSDQETWEPPTMSFEAYLNYDQPSKKTKKASKKKKDDHKKKDDKEEEDNKENDKEEGNRAPVSSITSALSPLFGTQEEDSLADSDWAWLRELSPDSDEDPECPFSRTYSKTPVFAGRSSQNSPSRRNTCHQQGLWGQHKDKALSHMPGLTQPLLKPTVDTGPPPQPGQQQKDHHRLKGQKDKEGNLLGTPLLKPPRQPEQPAHKTVTQPLPPPLQEAQGRSPAAGPAARAPGPHPAQSQGPATKAVLGHPAAHRPAHTLHQSQGHKGTTRPQPSSRQAQPDSQGSKKTPNPRQDRPESKTLSTTQALPRPVNTAHTSAKKPAPLMAKSRRDFQKMLLRR